MWLKFTQKKKTNKRNHKHFLPNKKRKWMEGKTPNLYHGKNSERADSPLIQHSKGFPSVTTPIPQQPVEVDL